LIARNRLLNDLAGPNLVFKLAIPGKLVALRRELAGKVPGFG
jgi:hypothetical protein